jgi:hypothetical protein
MTETRAGRTQDEDFISLVADDEDVISLVADVGEDVLRGFSFLLFSLPRRIVARTLDGVGDVLHGAAAMLGEVDPVDTRVAELEKRLDSLEKATGTRGTTPTRTKRAERRGEHEATEATKPSSEGEHAQ